MIADLTFARIVEARAHLFEVDSAQDLQIRALLGPNRMFKPPLLVLQLFLSDRVREVVGFGVACSLGRGT